jgi:hypothetical protein
MHLEAFDKIGIQNPSTSKLVFIGWGNGMNFRGFVLGAGQLALNLLRLFTLHGMKN